MCHEKEVQVQAAHLDSRGLREGLRRCIWIETKMWRRNQAWEDAQEETSGRGNSKCKGPVVGV